MNIFVLDKDPETAASYHCDKHVVKMIVESAQMLSTAHHVLDGDQAINNLYKKTHTNHPCSVWCRENSTNYIWLYDLFCSLCDEYTKRYNKVHLTDTKLREVLWDLPNNISNGRMTPFPKAMPEELKVKDAVASYRKYYKAKDIDMQWKNEIPQWYTA